MSLSARLMQPEANSGSAAGLPIRAVINKVKRDVDIRNIYPPGSE